MSSDDRRARRELYEVPGGNQVDGLPPVPVCPSLSGFWTLPSVITYLVELFGIVELEEFRRGVKLVGRPDQKGQCGNFWWSCENLKDI
eukprot:4021778-Pyramimonas_sp.AAC.1